MPAANSAELSRPMSRSDRSEGRREPPLFFGASAASGADERTRRRRRVVALVPALAVLALAGCGFWGGRRAGTAALPGEITGFVVTRDPVTLLPETELRVTLYELSAKAGRPSFVAETIVPRVARLPARFRIGVDPRVIDPGARYVVVARLVSGGRDVLESAPAETLTLGRPAALELVVAPVGSR